MLVFLEWCTFFVFYCLFSTVLLWTSIWVKSGILMCRLASSGDMMNFLVNLVWCTWIFFQFGKFATIAFICPCICVDHYAHWPWRDRRFLRWCNHLLTTDHFSLVIIVTTSNLTNHICWRPCQGRCNVHERQHRFSDYSYCKIWHFGCWVVADNSHQCIAQQFLSVGQSNCYFK